MFYGFSIPTSATFPRTIWDLMSVSDLLRYLWASGLYGPHAPIGFVAEMALHHLVPFVLQ